MKFLTFLLILFALHPISAQVAGGEGELITSSADKVMIIPFRSYNYLSDADYDLANANRLTASEISTRFRYGLDLSLAAQVGTIYDTYSILTDSAMSSAAELRRIYSSVSYKYQKPIDHTEGITDKKDSRNEDLFGRHIGEKTEEEADAKEYMNVLIRDPELLPHLANTYDVEYFIFINQFELLTNYEHCLDRSTNNFKRVIAVHYSIFDVNGNQMKGDVINVTFGSNDNNMNEIIGNYLPLITKGIKNELDRQVMVSNEPNN